jgi:iron complex transport system ATP-binding protein
LIEGKQSPLLEVQGACFSYDKTHYVFSDIALSFQPGDIFTILGPNGAGKTTLLNCISGYLPLISGSICISGTDLKNLSSNDRALSIGYVPQLQPQALDFSVRDYIVLGRAPHIGSFQTPGEKEYEIVERVMDQLKISYLSDKSLFQISGGERQQVQIARVLVQEPQIIMLDEPTNHLDYGNQLKILEMIVHLSEEDMLVILTSHMPDHAILLGGMVGILDREGHMNIGDADVIINEENLKKIYRAELHMVYIDEIGRKACVAGNLRCARKNASAGTN